MNPDVGQEAIEKLVVALGEPGSLKVIDPNKLVPDTAPQFPQYLVIMARDTISQIGSVSGITEILQGKDPKHRTARGIERIFEAATSRIGSSTRLMENALSEVALLMSSVAQQFYTEERTYALIGTSGIATGSITLNPDDLAGEFDISIDSGASLPKDKQSKADLMFNLLQNHIFDMALMDDPVKKQIAKIVLDTVEFPGREALLSFKAPQPALPPPSPAGQLSPGGTPTGGMGQPQLPPNASIPPELLAMIGQTRTAGPPAPPPTNTIANLPPDAMQAIQDMAKQLGANSPQQLLQMLGMTK